MAPAVNDVNVLRPATHLATEISSGCGLIAGLGTIWFAGSRAGGPKRGLLEQPDLPSGVAERPVKIPERRRWFES
jgi:hypothetical protein